ncbi:hypothetical protein [Mangrovimonas aestuarii]|uniref:hypothetical protein n=1 Tax=Mangrovimonas aestuarii TaxID=3018443 RepID=UPI0023792C6D|nr:hypothetical protein [Mangrovimonas aestuarii]
MKSLTKFYAAIAIPLALLIILAEIGIINSLIFSISLLVYVFVYRTWTDSTRLIEKGVLKSEDKWKLAIPGYRFDYLKELYLN